MNDLHPVGQQIKQAIETTVDNPAVVDKLTEDILRALDNNKLLYYADPGRISLLNSHGRVLIAILEDPFITQRALSVYLGVSESNINKSLRLLQKDGIIEKKKDGKRNLYHFNQVTGLAHPDIARFIQTLAPHFESPTKQQKPHQQSE